MFPKIEVHPKIIHFNKVLHNKPSILGYPYFWKHPCLNLDVRRFFFYGYVLFCLNCFFVMLMPEILFEKYSNKMRNENGSWTKQLQTLDLVDFAHPTCLFNNKTLKSIGILNPDQIKMSRYFCLVQIPHEKNKKKRANGWKPPTRSKKRFLVSLCRYIFAGSLVIQKIHINKSNISWDILGCELNPLPGCQIRFFWITYLKWNVWWWLQSPGGVEVSPKYVDGYFLGKHVWHRHGHGKLVNVRGNL